MSESEIQLLKEMHAKAVLAELGLQDYKDPKAKEKAALLEKLISIYDNKEESVYYGDKEFYIYKTTDKRNFRLNMEAWRMACSLYDILSWSRNIYNGKDYGMGTVIYRNKAYSRDEWDRMTSSFNKERKIEYDYDKHAYIDSEGEVSQDEVFFVYTGDQVVEEIDRLTHGISEFIYDFME